MIVYCLSSDIRKPQSSHPSKGKLTKMTTAGVCPTCGHSGRRVQKPFPVRLVTVLAKERADLYNKYVSVLTEREREAEGNRLGFAEHMAKLDQIIARLQSELNEVRNDPYNTPEARRERFNGMSEAVMENLIATSTKEFEDKVAHRESGIRAMREIQELLRNRNEHAHVV